MSLRRKYLLYTSVLLFLWFGVVSSKSLKFSGVKNMGEAIQNYFTREKTLYVVLAESEIEVFLLKFHVPVVVSNKDQVLSDCGREWLNQEGYVLMTTNAVTLEEQIVPLLKCFNQTTLKLTTKYILVLDVSKHITSNGLEIYSNLFYNLWVAFKIINISILPVKDNSVDTDPTVILSYNPFLTINFSSSSALKMSLTQDVRGVMTDRFRNLHGHGLNTVFFRTPEIFDTPNSIDDFNKKQTLGDDPGMLLKQLLESNLNVSFVGHEHTNNVLSLSKGTMLGAVEEFISGEAEYCTNFFFLHPRGNWFKQIQLIPTGYSVEMVFVVPKPRQVESWRLFQYTFQWQVCVSLGLALFFLSSSALLCVHVHSATNMSSEVVSVWKAVLSVPIIRLPKAPSQRLLIALSLLLGLIFTTLSSVQLFALIRSKPRMASIKTLQDLHDSNLPIYSNYDEFSLYLNSFENTTLCHLKENLKTGEMYENNPFSDPSYLNISERAVLYISRIIEYVSSLPQSKVFLQYFEVVKEPVFQTLMAVYLPIGSVYYDRFNDLNHRLISGGFYLKWYEAKKYRFLERYSSLSVSSVSEGAGSCFVDYKHVPLTYDDLKMAFYLLYTGLTVSAVCFLKEVCNF